MIRILIADDHPIVRQGLAEIIRRQSDLTLVGEAGTGREAVELYRRHRPDVAVLDLRMPDLDGTQATAAIRALQADACVLILTTFDRNDDIAPVVEAGASGCLLKDAPLDELLATIRSVHAGPAAARAELLSRVRERRHADGLTGREREVLREMTRGSSNKQVALALGITESTVKVHVNNLLRKLAVSSRTEAVTQALKRGIVRLE